MSYLLTLTTSQCFSNAWIPVYGVYWAVSSTSTTAAKIHMSKTGGYCPAGEGKYIKIGESAVFGNNEFTVKLEDAYRGQATILIFTYAAIPEEELPPEPEPEPELIGFPEAKIMSANMDAGMLYDINSKIDYHSAVANTGETGVVHLWVGIGYINQYDGQIYFTGSPVKESMTLQRGFSNMFTGSVNVKLTDYYAQDGTGWAWDAMPLKLFFIAGHDENGNIVWDTERNLNIVITEPPDYTDPTDPGDWFKPEPEPELPAKPEDVDVGFGFGKVTFTMPKILDYIRGLI